MPEQKPPKPHCMEVTDAVSSGCGAPLSTGWTTPFEFMVFLEVWFCSFKSAQCSLKGISPLGKVCNMG